MGKWQVYNDGKTLYIISGGNPREADCIATIGPKDNEAHQRRAALIAAAPETARERDELQKLVDESIKDAHYWKTQHKEIEKERDEWKKANDNGCKVILDQCKEIASLRYALARAEGKEVANAN